jgi:hypothetical protein
MAGMYIHKSSVPQTVRPIHNTCSFAIMSLRNLNKPSETLVCQHLVNYNGFDSDGEQELKAHSEYAGDRRSIELANMLCRKIE